MAYLGKTPSQAVRSRYYFTASGGETSLSGTDDNSNTLTFTDGNYVDVSLNGVALVAGSDYNTTTANTIGGLTALTASDVVEVVVYDTFSVFSGAFTGDISLGDNVKAKFGASDDLQIYHDGTHSYISDATGTGNLYLQSSSYLVLETGNGNENYLVAQENGPVTLYYDSAAKLATTATGIDVTGTITADNLTMSDSSTPQITLTDTTNSVTGVVFADNGEMELGHTSNHAFAVKTNDTERLRITNGGNVGIGETAPANLLHVKASDTGIAPHASAQIVLEREGTNYLQFLTAETGTSGILFGDGSDVDVAQIKYDHSTTSMQFVTEASEAFRIDSSRNLLVGTTNADPVTANVAGFVVDAGDDIKVSNNGVAGRFNRISSDGDILEFYKDGSEVGSIGVNSGDNLYINATNTGIKLLDDEASVVPAQSGGSNNDNALDLGFSSVRWKDLYLSGGAYLGGTGAANKLDDYEEGTFTATLNASSTTPTPRLTTTGQYTKIGNKVTVSFEFNNVTTTSYSGSISIFGMPFASSNPTGTVRQVTGSVGIYSMGTWDTASSGLFGRIGEGGTEWYLYANRSNDSWYAVQHSAGSQRYLIFNATYIVA